MLMLMMVMMMMMLLMLLIPFCTFWPAGPLSGQQALSTGNAPGPLGIRLTAPAAEHAPPRGPP